MSEHGAPEGVTTLEGSLPADELSGLLAAFRAYEAALMANDVTALDAAFAPGHATLRGDAAGLLVGHERISAFRALRGGLPPRVISEIHVRVVSPEAALIISVSLPVKGGSGLQTQLWEKRSGVWVITAAHVAAPAPAINGSVWRVVGAPLVPARPASAPDAGPRPLEGMTVAVKDLYDVAGFAVGAGIPEYLAGASVATADSDAVAALRSAGAVVQGIAQTDEFAYSIAGRNIHYGTPPNAVVPGAIPGGSSSGPASAVALGQVTIGLATDTAGSIRVPASYQGLWGIRTTHGAVSTRGVLPLAVSFDTVGWLTRSAAALRTAAEVSLGGAPGAGFAPQPSAFTASSRAAVLEGVRFAVSRDLVSSCAPAVQEAFDEFVELALPTAPDEVDLGDLDGLFLAFRTVQGAEAWRAHGEWIEAHPGVLAPDVAERFATASSITPEAEAAARDVLSRARARLDAVLEGRVLLLPSASSAAPAMNASLEEIAVVRSATLRMTAVAGVGGYPAVSAPVLRVPSGGGSAPVGLCLVGARGDDLALIDLAAALAPST
ncbi:MAG: DUF3225 domain-containing protein [Herbiconiux sp.]|nr:DUF3225 domain-containing protein [Herbiconiux sp.]